MQIHSVNKHVYKLKTTKKEIPRERISLCFLNVERNSKLWWEQLEASKYQFRNLIGYIRELRSSKEPREVLRKYRLSK